MLAMNLLSSHANKSGDDVRSTKMKLGLAVVSIVLGLATAGCVEREVVRTGPPPQQGVVVVQQPPPAEMVETAPPPPGPREIWVWQRGHWRWDGYGYHWNPGRWAQRPPRVNAWVAPHWEQRPNGWFF